jgi:hypothetical protein
MRNKFTQIFASCSFLFVFSGLIIGQEVSQQKAGIVDITPHAIVSVEFEIRAVDKPLVIPNCSNGEDSKPSPCVVHVERFDGKTWYSAKSRYSGAVLGFLAKDYWKPLVISPKKSAFFQQGIDLDFFGIRKGERLRIVVEAWDSPESMAKNEIPDSKFVSPTFICP